MTLEVRLDRTVISLGIGEKLERTFSEASAADFYWSCKANPEALEVSSEKIEKTPWSETGGSERTFTVKALKSGAHEIDFVHKLSWGPDVRQARYYTIDVKP
jgi:predicted secreted protein